MKIFGSWVRSLVDVCYFAGLHPLDIDAHWLQRKLSKYYEEAITSQKKSIEVSQRDLSVNSVQRSVRVLCTIS